MYSNEAEISNQDIYEDFKLKKTFGLFGMNKNIFSVLRVNKNCTNIIFPLRYERVYLPLCKVVDTPFYIQRDYIVFAGSLSITTPLYYYTKHR